MNESGVPCALCSSGGLKEFFRRQRTPVLSNRFYASENEALNAAMGDIALAHCSACGAIQNTRFEEQAVSYDENYENSLHFSETFRTFSGSLVDRLADQGFLQGAEVVELGCGRGEFLSLLCRRAACRGIGIDPALSDRIESTPGADLRFVKGSYGDLEIVTGETRLIVCRHVLEHLARPRKLLMAVSGCAQRAPDLRYYFEVPDAYAMLENDRLWDVIYEHPIHFTAQSLSALLRSCGYAIENIYSAFDDQYLCAEGTVAGGSDPTKAGGGWTPKAIPDDVLARFARKADANASHWHGFLEMQRQAGQTVILWGIGSKGVTFLNMLDDPARIAAAVDVNPRKHGRYVAGTGHRIVAPEALRAVRPDVVLVSNPLYRDEIEYDLGGLGLSVDLLPI